MIFFFFGFLNLQTPQNKMIYYSPAAQQQLSDILYLYRSHTKEVLTMSTVFKILKATGTTVGAAAAKFIIWLAGKLEGGK